MNINSSSSHKNKEPENSVLYIVGTPIGNLSDLSSRAINILKNVSLIACEDTRQTKKIMGRFKFTNNLISFNKHNSKKKIPIIIDELNSGKSIALVSDAGMPSICDPGEDLVKNVRSFEFKVVCIPGPCAAIAALVSSGLPSSKFIFEGFLPKKNSDREKVLFEISKSDKTIIIFESPHRLVKLLSELKDFLGGEREITKTFEEHIGNSIDEVLDFFKEKEAKGEFTIVIKGINKTNTNINLNKLELKKDLIDLTNAGLSLSAASKYLSKKNNVKKNDVYNILKDN